MDNTTPSQKCGRLLSFLVIILVMVRRVSTQAGDGVVVTQADFQALQAIKRELIDTKGFLQSWNDSGFGACSGGWAGIKCAGGQVIVIQLPWKLLAGKISHEIGQLQALRKFSLHDNLITGPIPHTLGMLPSLRGLQLFNNRLSASIPPSLASCALLQTLDLSNNSLTGLLPETLGKATKLLRLDVSFNSISGPIPVGVSALSSLAFLHLQHNNLTGEIPAALANRLPILVSFDVAYNNLSGWVPIRLAQRFNSTAFVGNIQLCGYSSASAPCRAPPPPPWEKAKRRRRRLGTKDIILIAAVALLVILVLLCCVLLFCLIRRRRSGAASNAKDDEKQASEGSGGGEGAGKLVHFDGSMAFTAEDLLCSTAEVMGKSTYGTVYKATLEDGSQVAVKRLREKITKSRREFEAEISVLGEIRHPNLVSFRAYYLGPKGEKLLVFDYMPIGSLAAFLHGRGSDSAVDWRTRKNIVRCVTQGLLHLHAQQNIIHGNLTSSNILLDEEGNARIADFGLSRLMSEAANSNVIATAGALGYRAPELSKLKKANSKTDVYSLGVVVLELLTGKPPGEAINGVDLPQWVASVVKEEWTNEVFDEELMKEASTSTIGDELLNMLKLALHCIDPSPAARPEMDQILHQLEQIRLAAATSSDEIRC